MEKNLNFVTYTKNMTRKIDTNISTKVTGKLLEAQFINTYELARVLKILCSDS